MRGCSQLQRQALSQVRIDDCINEHVDFIREAFHDFDSVFNPARNADMGRSPAKNAELASRIEREVGDDLDRRILHSFLEFNAHVLKTNFYKPSKRAISFRLYAHGLIGLSV